MAMMTGSSGEFLRTLVTPQPYKPGQGPWARNGTLAVGLILVLYGMYSWAGMQPADEPFLKWGIPFIVGGVCAWIVFRLVHYPRFADFLITTEAEMNKVNWPSKEELKASTAVVLVSTAIMALFLFVADMFWRLVLSWLGILKIGNLLGGGAQGMLPGNPISLVADVVSWLM